MLNLNMNHYRVSIDSGLLSQFNSQEKESTAHLSREGRSPGDWITQGSEHGASLLAGNLVHVCTIGKLGSTQMLALILYEVTYTSWRLSVLVVS